MRAYPLRWQAERAFANRVSVVGESSSPLTVCPRRVQIATVDTRGQVYRHS